MWLSLHNDFPLPYVRVKWKNRLERNREHVKCETKQLAIFTMPHVESGKPRVRTKLQPTFGSNTMSFLLVYILVCLCLWLQLLHWKTLPKLQIWVGFLVCVQVVCCLPNVILCVLFGWGLLFGWECGLMSTNPNLVQYTTVIQWWCRSVRGLHKVNSSFVYPVGPAVVRWFPIRL